MKKETQVELQKYGKTPSKQEQRRVRSPQTAAMETAVNWQWQTEKRRTTKAMIEETYQKDQQLQQQGRHAH